MYFWAANPLKLDRAIKNAKIEENTSGRKADEESVKEQYLALAGALVKDHVALKAQDKEAETEGVSFEKEAKPKRGRPSNADKAVAETAQE